MLATEQDPPETPASTRVLIRFATPRAAAVCELAVKRRMPPTSRGAIKVTAFTSKEVQLNLACRKSGMPTLRRTSDDVRSLLPHTNH